LKNKKKKLRKNDYRSREQVSPLKYPEVVSSKHVIYLFILYQQSTLYYAWKLRVVF